MHKTLNCLRIFFLNGRSALTRAQLLSVSVLTFFVCISVSFVSNATAQEQIFQEGNRLVKTTLVADRAVFQPSADGSASAARIGILFEIQPGWHIYWQNSGEAAIPTEIEWQVPEGWKTGSLQWPVPVKFAEKGEVTTYGYQDRVLLFTDLLNPPEIHSSSEAITVSAKVSWLVCSEVCVPGERLVSGTFDVDMFRALEPSAHLQSFEDAARVSPKTPSAPFEATLSNPFVEGAEATLAIVLPEKLVNAATGTGTITPDQVQLFPVPSEGMTVRRIALRNSNDQNTLLVALQREKGSSASPIFSGVIAIRSKGAFPSVFEFSFPITQTRVVVADGANSQKPSMRDAWKTSEALAYRVVSHDQSPAKDPDEEFSFAKFIFALLSAFGAGLVLNCMPCVLPVLSLKVISFVQHPGDTPKDHRRGAIYYSLGVLFAFLALALAVIALKKYGMQIGWGFQFQYPGFVFALALVVFILSLSFFDFYAVKLPGIQRANRFVSALDHEGAGRHFFDGVLATALSTPCSAPLLGTALAFAFTQPAIVTVLVFLSIGCGLSLPYLLIASNERLIHYLPRPGNWMEQLRQLFGFLLLGTVLWLLFVLHSLKPESLVPTLGLFLAGAFFLWFRRLFVNFRRAPDLLLAVGFSFLTWLVFPSDDMGSPMSSGTVIAEDWKPYNKEIVQAAVSEGKAVFIDFTADWCITCKFNERFVLHTSEMQKLFTDHDVQLFKADWTRKDPVITSELLKYGGRGVPYYVALKPGGEVVVLPTLLTDGAVESVFP